MNHSGSAAALSMLSGQLHYFNEHKAHFLRSYYRENSEEKRRAEQLLSVYCLILAKELRNPEAEMLCSYIMIGSRVDLEFIGSGKRSLQQKYLLVFPNRIDVRKNRISFLSPIGIQLLLANKGDHLTIDAPDKIYRAIVKDVAFTGIGCDPHDA